MGAFIVNVHVRTDELDALKSALDGLNLSRTYLSPPSQGWIAIYDEHCSTQDVNQITNLAHHLSQSLQAPVIAFLVHDSDVFCYWLYDRGELLDEYNSMPHYFSDEWDDTECEECAAQTDVLIRYACDGVTREQLDNLLRPHDGQDYDEALAMAEDSLCELAQLLGIDVELATVDFADLGRDCDADEMGLIFVGTGTPPDHGGIRSVRKPDLSDLQSAFVHSAAQNDVERIRELAAAGIDVNGADSFYKRSALVVAAQCGAIETAELLLQLGANVNASDEHGSTPVFHAATSGNGNMLRLLISHGADLEAANTNVGPPLAWAIHGHRTECVLLLLDAGADPNRPDLDGETPLHHAVNTENVRVVDQLLQHGADVNAENRKRKKPLDRLEELWEHWSDQLEIRGVDGPEAPQIKGHLSRLRAIRRYLTESSQD